MAVLVTGASGFLGGRLVQMLARRGDEVVILARAGSDLRHLSGAAVTVLRGDLSDRPFLEQAVHNVTQIFHCAACSTDWAPQATYVSANVTGTRNLLAAALLSPKLERFVHVSTTDIYGYPLTPCDEAQPFLDTGLPYNSTKGEGEALVWQAHQEHQLPITIVRPATIYGPRGKDFIVEIAAMLRHRLMATIDGGSAPGGFIYVDDVADAMMSAAGSSSASGQVYNLSGGTGATWLAYLTLFARQLHLPLPWINLPFSAAMAAARLFELPHRLLHLTGRPLLTRHAVYLLGRNQEFPIAKAVRELSFRPAFSLEQGLEHSVAWLRNTRHA